MAYIICPLFDWNIIENYFILCKNVVTERFSTHKDIGKDSFELYTAFLRCVILGENDIMCVSRQKMYTGHILKKIVFARITLNVTIEEY